MGKVWQNGRVYDTESGLYSPPHGSSGLSVHQGSSRYYPKNKRDEERKKRRARADRRYTKRFRRLLKW